MNKKEILLKIISLPESILKKLILDTYGIDLTDFEMMISINNEAIFYSKNKLDLELCISPDSDYIKETAGIDSVHYDNSSLIQSYIRMIESIFAESKSRKRAKKINNLDL